MQGFVKSLVLFCGIGVSVSYAETVSIELESPKKKIIHFDLPGQPLNNSLIEFAIQADITLIVPNDLIVDYQSAPVVGPFTKERALEQILSKAPLSFKYVKDTRTIYIEYVPEPELKSIAPPVFMDDTAMIEEVLVQSVTYPFRYHTIASSSVHSGLSIYDTARFINVLPEQLITDLQAVDLTDVLKNSSGITPADGLADSNDDFYIRGFPRNALFVDGFRLGSKVGVKLSTDMIDRVEILKGPSTVHYGQAEPGGIVNVVKKKPRDEFYRQADISYGTGNSVKYHFDLSAGVLPTSDSLSFRINYTNETVDELKDSTDIEFETIAPSIRWAPTENTTFDLGYLAQTSTFQRDQGTIIVTPGGGDIDLVSVSEPANQAIPFFQSEFELLSAELSHTFNSSWIVRGQYFYQKENRRGIRGDLDALLVNDVLVAGGDLDPDTEVVPVLGLLVPVPIGTEISGDGGVTIATLRSLYDERGNTEVNFARLYFDGSLDFLGLEHHLAFGFEWREEELHELYVLEERRDIRRITVGGDNQDETELIRGVFDRSPGIGDLVDRRQSLLFSDTGFYLQNNMEINEQWLATIGARYTITDAERLAHGATEVFHYKTVSNLSSQVGFTYQPNDSISLFANYSEAMKGNYHIDDTGSSVADPELSDQIELGLKLHTLNRKLVSTIAVFDINKENIVDTVFIDGFRQVRVSDKQSAVGLDMDVTVQLSGKSDLIGSFSYIQAEITEGVNKGNKPLLSSEQTGSLFVSHRFDAFGLSGFSANIGTYFVGDRFANNENTLMLEGYSTIDAGLGYAKNYRNNNYKFSLSVKNILDKEYFSSIEGGLRTNKGAGQTIVGKFSVDF